MGQILSDDKEEKINKISKYLLLEILKYIPFNRTLNFFKHNKKYQKDLNINLLTYQKCFIKNKLKFDYNFENKDNLLAFFQKEFHNFTSEEDKKSFIEILKKKFIKKKKLK